MSSDECKVGDYVYYIGTSQSRLMRGDRGRVGGIDTTDPTDDRPVFVEFGNGYDWSLEGYFSPDDLSPTQPE